MERSRELQYGPRPGICLVFSDADTVLSAFGRDSYNQVNVMLESPAAFAELTNAVNANPSLHVEAKHEAEVTEQGMKQFNGILNFVSYFVGAIMAVAATLGAANSLYAIVDSRRRELATLRAIGFSAGPIIAAMLSESILLALPGALIGAAFAWFCFNGFTTSPFGFSFHLAVTLPIVCLGIGWALVMGLVGGLSGPARGARAGYDSAAYSLILTASLWFRWKRPVLRSRWSASPLTTRRLRPACFASYSASSANWTAP